VHSPEGQQQVAEGPPPFFQRRIDARQAPAVSAEPKFDVVASRNADRSGHAAGGAGRPRPPAFAPPACRTQVRPRVWTSEGLSGGCHTASAMAGLPLRLL
jgi:hypothetical protein